MKKSVLYQYLGTNGTILSPVHLENIYSIKKYVLTAEIGKTLTKNNKDFVSSVTVPEDEVDEWYEIETGQK